MKIILTWDGDKADLLNEDNGMSLVDNIIYAVNYASLDTVVQHNNIKIKVKRGK